MDPSTSQALPWIVAAIAAVVALAIGWALGRRSARDAIERVHDLEERLVIAEEDMARYRSQVSEHFGETSRLLRDLTLQYRNVYEHLAEGARTLCPEGAQLLAPSLAEEASLAAEASRDEGAAGRPRRAEEAAAEDESQLDLELGAEGRWGSEEDAGRDDLELDAPEEAAAPRAEDAAEVAAPAPGPASEGESEREAQTAAATSH